MKMTRKQLRIKQQLDHLHALQEAQEHQMHMEAMELAEKIETLEDELTEATCSHFGFDPTLSGRFAHLAESTAKSRVKAAKAELHDLLVKLHGENYGYDSNITNRYGLKCWI